jgi:probable HAF family extracellular repeat protein
MRRTSRLIRVIVLAVAAVGSANVTVALAAPGDIYSLGTLGGTYSEGWGINDAGQIAGAAYITGDTYRAFRYTGTPGSGGTMADLGALTAGQTLGYGINGSGQVAGTTYPSNAPPHAFRYSGTPGAGGALVNLDPGGTFFSSYGRAVNDAGHVAGYAEPAGGSNFHAFRYTGTPGSGGAMVDLGTLGGNESRGFGINNAGQVTGWSQRTDGLTRAFLYTGTPGSGGAMVDLGTPGGLESSGSAINNAGQVTGHYDTTAQGYYEVRAFRYTPGPGGGMVDLGGGHGNAINDAGFVIGESGSFPTLWQIDAANTAVNLDEWLDVTNPTLGADWSLRSFGRASDISNHGLITGWGFYYPANQYRAYLLDASSLVPEPAALGLLSVGPLSVLRRRRCSTRGSSTAATAWSSSGSSPSGASTRPFAKTSRR